MQRHAACVECSDARRGSDDTGLVGLLDDLSQQGRLTRPRLPGEEYVVLAVGYELLDIVLSLHPRACTWFWGQRYGFALGR